jgi:hypothetical protein
VAIAYYGTRSLYDAVTKKYGYQENFPNDDEPLSMPKEVYKLIRDQDQDGEFYDPIKDDEDLVKEQFHGESFQEEEYLDKVQYSDEQKETLVSMFLPEEDDVTSSLLSSCIKLKKQLVPMMENLKIQLKPP